jgi:CubicO group peptidase (beta-lactamase class C family)
VPAEALIERRLLAALGMRDTIPLLRDGDPRVERVACKHAGGRGRWRQYWCWGGAPYFSFPMFAQGFYSTPADYARFLAMVMDGGVVDGERLLSEAAIGRMLTPASTTTMPTGFAGLRSSYGQLMHLYDEEGEVVAFGHSGSDGTYAWAWPARDLMVLYFTQSRGSTTMSRMEAVIDSLIARPVPEDE